MSFRDDTYYINEILGGKSSSFAYLIEKYQQMAYNLTYRMIRNNEDAQEVCQDALLKAFRSLDTFHQQSKFSTWLYSIIYNTSISFLRRKKKIITEDIDSDSNHFSQFDDTVNQLEQLKIEEQKRYIEIALKELKPDESFIISMYYLHEHKVEEISEMTELSVSNIKIKLHRGRKKLYQALEVLLKEEINSLI